jgi:hypothetical protein
MPQTAWPLGLASLLKKLEILSQILLIHKSGAEQIREDSKRRTQNKEVDMKIILKFILHIMNVKVWIHCSVQWRVVLKTVMYLRVLVKDTELNLRVLHKTSNSFSLAKFLFRFQRLLSSLEKSLTAQTYCATVEDRRVVETLNTVYEQVT